MSRYGLEIRAAAPADAAGVAEFLAANGLVIPAEAIAARLAAIRTGPGTALLAQDWGPPCGLVVLDWHPVLTADRPQARLSFLLVGLTDRRRGIGRLLVKAAAQAARAARCASLDILADGAQPDLAAFLASSGFEPAGVAYRRGLLRQH